MGLTALGRVDKFEHVGKWPVQDIPLPQAGGARGGRDPGLDPGELLTWPLQNNADVAPAHPLTPSRLREGE
ncbi:hypothetical protein SIDU_11105 [Sphingobium indicum B90A]|uniref:Uncharacterized protein n=1 Tax=Sphingobium indicum (strain DSM 16412 / CCM 7286 / MTCC 6364 / B90A) TaxID=861109 RepID=A0A1L5BQ61_SPHIB|nr:hypothetical protein SIDU_11105 [Sphingobium indicum B90A]NYI23808.1 hypothetical protein [Sphingobium indicum]